MSSFTFENITDVVVSCSYSMASLSFFISIYSQRYLKVFKRQLAQLKFLIVKAEIAVEKC